MPFPLGADHTVLHFLNSAYHYLQHCVYNHLLIVSLPWEDYMRHIQMALLAQGVKVSVTSLIPKMHMVEKRTSPLLSSTSMHAYNTLNECIYFIRAAILTTVGYFLIPIVQSSQQKLVHYC